jgi:peptidoglycan/xylan/chitin deacetylase (PgdA/CDA1 family)
VIGTLASAAAVTGGVLAWGAFERNSPLFGAVQHRLPATEPVVGLTFDDGPNPEATPAILDALGAAGVRATFFVLGRHADRWPELVDRAAREGHAIGNHGYHHRKLTWRAPAFVRDDIARGAQAIQHAGGLRPTMFRAPHGHRNPWVTPIARSQGQRTIGWTLGVWDTARPGERAIAHRVLRGVSLGSIVLLHDGDGYDPHGDRMQTARAIPLIIDGLRERGYSFVSLSPT